jgi:hypothetical protein
MPRLFIPALGTRLLLTSAWTFDLYEESRNATMFQVFGFNKSGWGGNINLLPPVKEGTAEISVWSNNLNARSPKTVPLFISKIDPAIPNTIVKDLLSASTVVDKRINDYQRNPRDDSALYMQESGHIIMTLPVNTILKLDRIYIRQGSEEYDSITFLVEDCPYPELRGKKAKGFLTGKLRFWAKLDDVNTIDCNIL